MNSSHSLVERMAIRIYRAVMRLPFPEDAAESNCFRGDNPALRFRQLQAAADVVVRHLEAKVRFWSKLSTLIGRLSLVAFLISFVFFLLTGQAAHLVWASRHADVALQLKAAASPVAALALPPLKVTVAVWLGAGLLWYAGRLLKRRVGLHLMLAIRTRNDFTAFVLRRRHIVPLQEDCDILEMQLQRLSEKGGPKASATDSRHPAAEEGESLPWFSFRALRTKIACWLW